MPQGRDPCIGCGSTSYMSSPGGLNICCACSNSMTVSAGHNYSTNNNVYSSIVSVPIATTGSVRLANSAGSGWTYLPADPHYTLGSPNTLSSSYTYMYADDEEKRWMRHVLEHVLEIIEARNPNDLLIDTVKGALDYKINADHHGRLDKIARMYGWNTWDQVLELAQRDETAKRYYPTAMWETTAEDVERAKSVVEFAKSYVKENKT